MQVESAPQALPRRRVPRGLNRRASGALRSPRTIALVLYRRHGRDGAPDRLGARLRALARAARRAIPLPKKGYHSYVEFSNRIVAFLTVVATLVLAVAAWLTTGLRRFVKVLATIVFVGTLGSAARRAHGLLPPQPLARDQPSAALARRARPRRARARGGVETRSRWRPAATRACARGRGRPACECRRARLLRHARDRGREVPRELRRRSRPPARLLPAVRGAARPRGRRLRNRRSSLLAVWAWRQPRPLPVARARLRACCSRSCSCRWRSARSSTAPTATSRGGSCSCT